MVSISLKEGLINRWKRRELSNFYILKNDKSDRELSTSWINHLLQEMLFLHFEKKLSNSEIQSHPDIYFMEKIEKTKLYTVDEFNNFFKFLSLKHFELPWRFIIINDAELISEKLSNKLLKSLEAPTEKTTIFYLFNSNRAILPTILSRGITLFLQSNDFVNSVDRKITNISDIVQWIETHITTEKKVPKKYTISKDVYNSLICYVKNISNELSLLDSLKKNSRDQLTFLNIAIDIELQKDTLFKSKERYLKTLQWFDVSRTYNNSVLERFLPIVKSLPRFCDEH